MTVTVLWVVLSLIVLHIVSARHVTACDSDCIGGACFFKDCQESTTCGGGACTFMRCIDPVCQGGGCLFDECVNPKCPGGGCDFINTKETLKPGYCEGESCKYEGRPHPSMREGHVSL